MPSAFSRKFATHSIPGAIKSGGSCQAIATLKLAGMVLMSAIARPKLGCERRDNRCLSVSVALSEVLGQQSKLAERLQDHPQLQQTAEGFLS